ncbi:CocE/NonD family hydrolase [Nocardioides conyzicola]|uniref:Xaa-Pro dipeptidyl-peptidase C-terminal domain-containing protein n=1 Tax=Nocardioides conyzicola TaxID=1651781 RepID=A0ABP8Y3Q2_9ACTN
MRSLRRTSLAAIALLALVAGALAATNTATADAPPFAVRGSINQLYVLGATPSQGLELVKGGAVVGTGTVDTAGSFAWRELDPGAYTVRSTNGSNEEHTATVTDYDDPAPAQSFYDAQTLEAGRDYITTRDGTTLSANVVLPSSGSAPYPTVVEYSGYDPSNPANTRMAQIYTALGYAYVGVNIRGTGCSGGSFRNFEPVQSLDGYDVIETVAAQSWAKFHKVGMVGISYPGIEQLYVAQTQPPHLSAISPLSVIDDTYQGTLYPGGILNTGFAVPWATERDESAKPYGQGWEQGQVDGGDTTCADNQALRLQNPSSLDLIQDNPFYTKKIGDPISPALFVHKINVPVFLAGAWQDEQTGGHFPAMLDDFTSSPHLYATMTNGSHTESLSLGVLDRYADFLDLYVGRRTPTGVKAFVGPLVADGITGVKGLQMPKGLDYSGLSYAQALKKFQRQDPIRILFEEGAADGQDPGSPLPRFEKSFKSWPIARAKATAWFLSPGGKLTAKPSKLAPSKARQRSYRADPSALPTTTFDGPGSIWAAQPSYHWKQIPKGKGLGWITPPLKKTVVSIGTGSADLWVRTPNASDTDLEVTISEVRPSGKEVYVQSGWLRASHRKLDRAKSTPISPVHTNREADASPLSRTKFTRVRLELFPFAQPFRKGSRIRITLDAPGGARPTWAFDTIAHGERVQVATDRVHRSRIVLPLVAGVAVPRKAPPACGSLRSQPCRTYLD